MMKKAINYLKRIFLAISRSSVINWILFVGLLGCLAVGIDKPVVYEALATFFCLEVMFLNANKQ